MGALHRYPGARHRPLGARRQGLHADGHSYKGPGPAMFQLPPGYSLQHPLAGISRHSPTRHSPTGSSSICMLLSESMNKHPATWFLVTLLALGAGQALPRSRMQRSTEICVIVFVIEVRGEQRVPRERRTPGYAQRDHGPSYSHELPTIIRLFWNSSLLRAPPFSPLD